jgi:hypothetical protein
VPSVVSAHQVSVDSFRRRGRHPGDDQREHQVPLRAGRAQQRRQAEFHGHRVHGGDVAVRQRPGDRHRLPGRRQRGAGQRRLDRVDDLLGQAGQVRQRLVPDPGPSR